MTISNSKTVIVFLSGISAAMMMIVSDYFLRDRVFGINLIIFPLAFIVASFLGLKTINNIDNYTPTFYKSAFLSILMALISSLLFAFYWTLEIGFQYENLYGATLMNLPFSILLAIFIGFFFDKK